MSDVDEQISKLREHVPDDKTDADIRALIEDSGGDEVSTLNRHRLDERSMAFAYSQAVRTWIPNARSLLAEV